MNLIPYGRQHIDKDDINEVKKSLKQKLITTGLYVKKFEIQIKNKLQVPFAFTCTSGTAALHLAFLSTGIQKNDVIILPGINFIAAANLAVQMGAKIFFSDVDSNTGQTTPELIKDCIKKNKIKKIKAIVIMFHGGNPRNIGGFYNLKKKYKFTLIEDSCHAFGASYIFSNKKYMVGSCKHSDISTFSLHPLKTITTGEGGIVTTRNKKIAKKIQLYRSHGLERERNRHWSYNARVNGFNYRLSDINCALGYSQIKKLKKFIKKRENLFKLYQKKFNNFKSFCKVIEPEKNTSSSFHLLMIKIDFKKIRYNKTNLIKFFLKKGIITQYHYIPFYKFTSFKSYKNKHKNKFKGCKTFFDKVLSLPIYYDLSNHNVIKITNIMKKNIFNKSNYF